MPKGTAYIDILGKLPTDSEYYSALNDDAVAVRDEDGKISQDDDISINVASPIVLYDTDGYRSLSAHLKNASLTVKLSGRMYSGGTLVIDSTNGPDASAVYKKYGRFKAAYVSETGEVLGVTDTAVSTLTKENSYRMKVDGTTAVYEFHSESADNAKRLQDPVGLLSMGVYVMFLIMLVALGVIVIRNIWRFIKQMRKK